MTDEMKSCCSEVCGILEDCCTKLETSCGDNPVVKGCCAMLRGCCECLRSFCCDQGVCVNGEATGEEKMAVTP